MHDRSGGAWENGEMSGTRLVLILVGGAATLVVVFQLLNMLGS
jgi:hypothetical protein